MELKEGYKQTEVGVIPGDWEVNSLPEICRFRSGKAHEQFISDTGEYICVNSKFISTEGAIRKYSSANFCPAKTGDVLMVMSDLPNGKALAKAFIADQDRRYAVNQRVCALTPYNSVSSGYLFYTLNRHPYFLKFDDGVNQTHLLNYVFAKCPVALPPTKAEQEAIAEALSDADALIESQEQLIAKKRQIKQGAMQEILTGEKRLPGFSGEWEVKRLGSVSSMKGRIGWQGLKQTEFNENPDDPFLITGMNFNDGEIRWNEVYHIPESRYEIAPEIQLRPDDLLMTKDGTIGKLLFVREIPYPHKASLNSHLLLFRPIADSYFPLFFYYLFQTREFEEQIDLNKSGTTFFGITQGALEEFKIRLPTLDEQTAIATMLSDMDAEISALETKLAKARQVKQGMMQELLTGRTRLI